MQKSKLLDLVIAVLCALALWLYVVTVVTPEDDLTIGNIPVTFVGESELRSERELIISNRSVSDVAVRFHGSRAVLKRLDNERSGITASVDVSAYTVERDYSVSYTVNLPTSLQDNSITVTDRSPRTIQFTVEKLAKKPVPVKGVFDGQVAEGYQAGEITFDQDVVTIIGPSALVEQVDYAQIVVGGENVSQSIDDRVKFTLVDAAGTPIRSEDLSSDTEDIGVRVPILLERSVPLTVTVLPGGGAAEEDVAIRIQPDTVTARGERAAWLGVESLSLGEIDLAEIARSTTLTLPIQLPEGLTVDGIGEASVSVTFRNLITKEIPLAQVRIEGVADGVEAKITDLPVTITLRGHAEDLSAVDPETLEGVIDLTEYPDSGSFTVPIALDTEALNVGMLGEPTVTVEITDRSSR